MTVGVESAYRFAFLAALLGSLAVSTVYRLRARRAGGQIARSAEDPAFRCARVLVGLPLFLGALVWLLRPAWMAWAQLPLPHWLRLAGVVLALLALPLNLWVFRTLGNNVSETVLTKPGQTLVQSGPYGAVRHPLYSAGIMLFLGLGLIAANAFLLAMAMLSLVLVAAVVVPREEAHLIDAFGDEYRSYRRRTGALLPRIARGS